MRVQCKHIAERGSARELTTVAPSTVCARRAEHALECLTQPTSLHLRNLSPKPDPISLSLRYPSIFLTPAQP